VWISSAWISSLDLRTLETRISVYRQPCCRMSYLLRVTPPAAMKELAQEFDDVVLETATTLLDLEGEVNSQQYKDHFSLVQLPLRYGGFGMTSAVASSHISYLSSVASVGCVSAFAGYASGSSSLPTHSHLYSHLNDCISTIRTISSDCAKLIPTDADTFFSFFPSSDAVSTLQHKLNQSATQTKFNAAVENAQEHNDTHTEARLKCYSATSAFEWKNARPSNPQLTLNDTHYRICARMNLGINVRGLAPECPICHRPDAVKKDPLHYLSCTGYNGKAITHRHNAVLNVAYLYTNAVGGVAVKEPRDLHSDDGRVPDLQMLIRDKHWLSDVYVINPMAPSYRQQAAQRQLSAAGLGEYRKEHKYHGTALAHGATFVPFVVESAGGLGEGAVQIIEEIVLASRDNNTLVHHKIVSQQLKAAIGIAVQKGNAIAMIVGRNRALGRAATCAAA